MIIMRITEKNYHRLEYVEKELKLLNNTHLGTVVHNVLEAISESPEYVYVLKEEGVWDYESASSTEVFNDFHTAVRAFEQKVKDAKTDMNDWLTPDEQDISEQEINEESETANFEICEDGNFSRLHCCINIIKKEVK